MDELIFNPSIEEIVNAPLEGYTSVGKQCHQQVDGIEKFNHVKCQWKNNTGHL